MSARKLLAKLKPQMFCKVDRVHCHKLVLAKTVLIFVSPAWVKMGRLLITRDESKDLASATVRNIVKTCANAHSRIRNPCLVGFAASSILTIPTSEKQFHEGKTCIFPPNAFANDYATKRKNAQSICQVRVKCPRARTRDSCDERPIR